jgi:hypothetical protein
LLPHVVSETNFSVDAVAVGGFRMQREGIAAAFTVASVLSAGVALAQSDDQSNRRRHLYLELFGIESVTEDPGVWLFPMFEGSGCDVDLSVVRNLLHMEEQKDRGIKLRFVSRSEFDEREKELYERPEKILKAAKEPHLADFQADLWKDAVREANHYGGMPALNFTVWTARIEQTCLAFIDAKLTTSVHLRGPGPSRYVTVELWSENESVRVPKANYTVSIAAAASSLWSKFIDDWKRTQVHCAAQTDPCRPSIANEE